MIEYSHRQRSSQKQHSCRVITADKDQFYNLYRAMPIVATPSPASSVLQFSEVVVSYAERKIVRPAVRRFVSYVMVTDSVSSSVNGERVEIKRRNARHCKATKKLLIVRASNLGRRPRARGRGCRGSHFGRRDWCIRFSFCNYQLVIGWHGT
jgi:hypothetical protein